ncbi:armadillo repeat-containing protein 6-like [Mercenaria mercenaria]|uniref:armadillo repeat-containing protein 6-like n=1 Tax=Mercenaria mercenaria TaxID=6596 RepID=UPI00234F130C|nr:armadillo repeat-containing protein 6-like [Mercenaria mercenaria]
MAKQISQETFDDVVKENIEDFEMSVVEAVADAVQQFESQGVNLSMIIRDASLYSPDGQKSVHPVIEALKALSLDADQGAQNSDPNKQLDIVKQECDLDLSRRCFAGKNNAYQVLLKSLKRFRTANKEMFVKTLETMCSLCNGQPDLLDEEGAEYFMDIMKDDKNDETVIALTVKLVRLNCIKHETNRKMFVKNDLIKELVRVLTSNKKSPTIVKEVAYGLRVLTQDDDVRVPFGSAHENAKQIVIEGDALRQLLAICSDYTSDVNVQGELFSTLSKLVVRDEFCTEVKDLGGLELILKSFQTNLTQKGIVRQALELLKALAGNDDIKIAIVKSGGVQLILAAMTQHQGNPQIAAAGCQTLAAIVLRQPAHCSVVIENNGHHVILQAMKVHPNDESVQKQACMAIRNIVARTRDHCAVLLELGAEELINRARNLKSCEDEAKAALRDLDCQVDLKERWTGEKGSLPQTAY